MWNCNTLVDDYIAEARIEENGNESGISKELQLFGRKKEAAMEKPGKMKIHICSSNDLQYLWFESGHFGNSNLPLVATILEKCSRSKERFPFTSSISALFGMREHRFTNLFFLLNMEARSLNDWLLEDAVSAILMEQYQDLWYCYLCVYFDEFYLWIPMIDWSNY